MDVYGMFQKLVGSNKELEKKLEPHLKGLIKIPENFENIDPYALCPEQNPNRPKVELPEFNFSSPLPDIAKNVDGINQILSDFRSIAEAAMIEAKAAQKSADSVNKKMLWWTIIMGIATIITGGIAIASLLIAILWR